jgi:DNA-binding MarR family transcriptional regulator
MPKFTPEQQAVAKASRNRMQLRRQFGLSFQAVECLLKLAHLRAFEKPRATQSDVARALGINRSRVCAHLRRAATVGLLARVGRSYFFRLNMLSSVETQAEIARRAASLKRDFKRKVLEIKADLGFVADRATHTPKVYIKAIEQAISDRLDNQKALKAMYVPVHLRKGAEKC